MKKKVKQPKLYLNYDNPLPNVDVVADELANAWEPGPVVTAPRIKTPAEKELEELKDPFGMPTLEEFMYKFFKRRGIDFPLFGRTKFIPTFDGGVEGDSIAQDKFVPNQVVQGYSPMYNYTFENPYVGTELSWSSLNHPSVAINDVNQARGYNRNWTLGRNENYGTLKDYFDKHSSGWGTGKGFNVFDKLFRTKRYQNARDAFLNQQMNVPYVIQGTGNGPGSGFYDPESNTIALNYIRDYTEPVKDLTLATRAYNKDLYNPIVKTAEDIVGAEDAQDVIARLQQLRAKNNLSPLHEFKKKDIKALRKGVEEGYNVDYDIFNRYSNKLIKKLMNSIYDCGKSIKKCDDGTSPYRPEYDDELSIYGQDSSLGNSYAESEFQKGVEDAARYYGSQGYRDRRALGKTFDYDNEEDYSPRKNPRPVLTQRGASTQADIRTGVITYNPNQERARVSPEVVNAELRRVGGLSDAEIAEIESQYPPLNLYAFDERVPYLMGAHEGPHVQNTNPGSSLLDGANSTFSREQLEAMNNPDKFGYRHDRLSAEEYADAIATRTAMTRLGIYDQNRSIYNEDGSRYEFTKDMYERYLNSPYGKRDRTLRRYTYEQLKPIIEELARGGSENNLPSNMARADLGLNPRKSIKPVRHK